MKLNFTKDKKMGKKGNVKASMTMEEIDALFGTYRDGLLTPSDFEQILSDILQIDIELPEYMQRVMTVSDYMQACTMLDSTIADAIQLDFETYGNLNVSDIKQVFIKLASDYPGAGVPV
jgi:hypothetical protein